MSFYFDFYYPSKENPQFTVSPTDEGRSYMFTLYNGGKIESAFSVNADLIHSFQATGHTGKDAEAIAKFGRFLKGLGGV
jgi:hypothetical protein